MMKLLNASLTIALIAMTYAYVQLGHELQWAKYDLYQEEATTWQLMWNPVCRYPEINDPRMATMKKFCDASNAGRKEYLEWYSKTMQRPIPEFPS